MINLSALVVLALASAPAAAQSAAAQSAARAGSRATAIPAFSAPLGAPAPAAVLASPVAPSLGAVPAFAAASPAHVLDLAASPVALPALPAPNALPGQESSAFAAERGQAAVSELGGRVPVSPLESASIAADRPAAVFDGSRRRGGDVAASAPVPSDRSARSVPSRSGRLVRAAGAVAAAAGLVVAAPAAAMAAGTAAGASAVALMASYFPLISGVAAVLGAAYGFWTRVRAADANPGQIFSSLLSHGAVAGAASYSLLDVSQALLLGAAITGITPLTAAVATGALAHAAFSGKFSDPATTSADRLMGSFPAIAASFGLTLGAAAFLAPAGLAMTAGTAALALTGAATALFVALYNPATSPAGGPAAMSRGFVLQVLMTGLAAALGDQRYALFFLGLGLAGLTSVLIATAREAWAAMPQSVRAFFAR